jgi:hypothetical protein
MKLIFTYSIWLTILCIGCGLLYAGVLYFKDKRLNELSKFWVRTLATLRFLSVTLLTFLLLEPLFETNKSTTEKPIIAIIHDNSESIVFNKDSLFIKNEYTKELTKLKQVLANKYEVKSYAFDNNLYPTDSLTFSGKETNISKTIKEINNSYYNRNLGAIILATDGIYNQGSNPFFEAKKLKNIPIYSIALGDTTPSKDVLIENIANNRLAYKGNDFPAEVTLKASGFKDKKSILKIFKNNTVLAQQKIIFNNDEFITTITFSLATNAIGLQKYTAVIESLNGEYSVTNNSKSFYVDVLESKQKILLLANSPHPDVAQIKRAIESNKNYEVTTKIITDFDNKIDAYSLVILHNLPSFNNNINNLSQVLENKKTPLFFILGNQTNYTSFNNLKTGLTIASVNSFSEAQGYVNDKFTLFKYSDNLKGKLTKLPPLQVPFSRDFKLTNASEVLVYQKIGFTQTKYPLLAFDKQSSKKRGFLIGEGIWKWKYFDFLDNENNNVFNELITQTIQYLVAKEDKSFFRVYSENIFKENEAIFIEAEVYNKSYELDNSADISITIKNEADDEFPFNFTKTSDRYELKASIFPAGNYKYTAKTVLVGKEYQKAGEFTITELTAEQTNSVANHQLLFNMADVTEGKMYLPDQLNQLEKDIETRKDLVSIIYNKKEVNDLINLKWIFFIILFLLSIEWFFRKRNGAY